MASTASTASPAPRAGAGSRWTALAASALGWLFDGYETYALILVAGVAVPQLLSPAERSEVSSRIGLVLAVTLLGWATGGVLSGMLADYLGRKRLLMLTVLWYAGFTGLTALSQDYWQLVALRFLTGLGIGGEWGPGAALVGEIWPPATRGRAAAALQATTGVGAVLAAGIWLVVEPLGESSWRYMFVLGVLPALVVLYFRRGLRDPALWLEVAERRRAARERAASEAPLADADRQLLRFSLTHLIATPGLRGRLARLLVLSLVSIVGYWSVSTWIPQYATEIAARAGKASGAWSQWAGIAFNLGAVGGFLAYGLLADRWGRKPVLWAYFLGSMPAAWSLYLLVRDPVALLLAAALVGFFIAGQFSWMAVYLPELFPTAVRATAIALVFNSARYVAALGPLVAGELIGRLGGIATAASLMALFYVVGLLVTPFAGPETKGQPLPE